MELIKKSLGSILTRMREAIAPHEADSAIFTLSGDNLLLTPGARVHGLRLAMFSNGVRYAIVLRRDGARVCVISYTCANDMAEEFQRLRASIGKWLTDASAKWNFPTAAYAVHGYDPMSGDEL